MDNPHFDYRVFDAPPDDNRLRELNKFILRVCCKSTQHATEILMTNQAKFFSMRKVRIMLREFIDNMRADTANTAISTLVYYMYLLLTTSTGYQRIGACMLVYACKEYLPRAFWESEINLCNTDTYWLEIFLHYCAENNDLNNETVLDHIIESEAEKIPVKFAMDKWNAPLQITFID